MTGTSCDTWAGPDEEDEASEPSADAAPRRPLAVAGIALAAVVGVTGAVLGFVALTAESAVPPTLPPGASERGGAVETVPDTAEADLPPFADARRWPSQRSDIAQSISPEWLERTATATGIPHRALRAYAGAQLRLMQEQPHCRISWPTLAAIGEVESDHGAHAGGEIAADGTTTVRVIGIPLDGTNGTAAIPDTDGGRLDGDTEWDRAVGPMQFIPTTWEIWGVAAGPGEPDPHDLDDAAFSAARYLCAEGRVLTTSEGWWAAILSYNQSQEYGEHVLAVANKYVDAVS